MNLTPGTYKARAVAPAVVAKSSQKETPGITVSLRLEDGPNKGAIIEWTGWLSDGAKPRTIESLVLMGFDGDDLASVQKNEVIAVLDNETREYEGKTYTETRVKWINDPSRASGAKFLPLSDAEKAVIAGDIRAAVAVHRAAAAKSEEKALEFPPKDVPKPKF